jgi:hypothetical protein
VVRIVPCRMTKVRGDVLPAPDRAYRSWVKHGRLRRTMGG